MLFVTGFHDAKIRLVAVAIDVQSKIDIDVSCKEERKNGPGSLFLVRPTINSTRVNREFYSFSSISQSDSME